MNAYAVTDIPFNLWVASFYACVYNRINILLLTNSKEVVYVTEPEKTVAVISIQHSLLSCTSHTQFLLQLMESFPNDFQRDNYKLKRDKNTKWGKIKKGRKKSASSYCVHVYAFLLYLDGIVLLGPLRCQIITCK